MITGTLHTYITREKLVIFTDTDKFHNMLLENRRGEFSFHADINMFLKGPDVFIVPSSLCSTCLFLKTVCRGGLTKHGPSVSVTVYFTLTYPPTNTSTHRSHPCHRSLPVSVRASNRKGTLDQWPSDSRRLITSHSSPTSLF